MTATRAGADPLSAAERLLELHAQELPQKDDLCGAFWASLAVRAAGIAVVDQDEAALAAGSLVWPGEPEALPPHEVGRRDYRVKLPTAPRPSLSGTSAAGVARAVETLGSGALTTVPVAGDWTPQVVRDLLDVAATADATVVANVGTRFLWGSRPTPSELLMYLLTGVDAGPAPDWDVGHFVGLASAIDSDAGTLIVVLDTYRTLGWQGVHLQPAERVAESLNRPGMSPGGVLLIVRGGVAASVTAGAEALGLRVGFWDNGTPDGG